MTALEFELIFAFDDTNKKDEIDDIKQCALLIYKISSLTTYEAVAKANELFKEKICYKAAIAAYDGTPSTTFEKTYEEARRMYESKYEPRIKEYCLACLRSYRKENEK